MNFPQADTLFEDLDIEAPGIVALTIGAPGGRQLNDAEEIVLKAAQPKNVLVRTRPFT